MVARCALCSESGAMVSGYGVLCEVFEAGMTGADPGDEELASLSFKARANHRFRFLDMPETGLPMHMYAR